MLIVVTYDIEDNKQRTRLFKTLKRFGEPVQFSVFECILGPGQVEQMMREVAEVLEHTELRRVRYYEICEDCRCRIVSLGKAFTTRVKRVYIL